MPVSRETPCMRDHVGNLLKRKSGLAHVAFKSVLPKIGPQCAVQFVDMLFYIFFQFFQAVDPE